jgi:quinol monooxygenase YgiN
MPESDGPTRVLQITLLRVRADRVDAVAAQLERPAEPSRVQPGCISFEVLLGDADPQDFAVVEGWKDPAALDAHLAWPPMAKVLHEVVGELESGLEIRRYRVRA